MSSQDSIRPCDTCEFNNFAGSLSDGALAVDDEKCVFMRAEILNALGKEVSCGVAGAAIMYLTGEDKRVMTGEVDA